MGFRLQFTFDYNNKHALSHLGVVCHLTVQVLTQWTPGANSFIHQDLPSTAAGPTTVERAQTRYGIRVAKRVVGSYRTFDIFKIVTTLVNFVVLVQLPKRFVCFVLLYCLGLNSEIHRRAVRSKFNAISYFQNGVARILIAQAGFCSLMRGKWKCTAGNLTKSSLFEHMCDIYKDRLNSGEMQLDTLKSLTGVFCAYADHGDTGDISCQEFISVATQNAHSLDVHFAARFFSRLSRRQQNSYQDFVGNDLTNIFHRVTTWSHRSSAHERHIEGPDVTNCTGIVSECGPQLQERCMHAGQTELEGDRWTPTLRDEVGQDDSSCHEEPQEDPQEDRPEVREVKTQSQSKLVHHASCPELPGTPVVELGPPVDDEGLHVRPYSEEVSESAEFS
jgi:hypothetical protein